jgi:hypothetical protein
MIGDGGAEELLGLCDAGIGEERGGDEFGHIERFYAARGFISAVGSRR